MTLPTSPTWDLADFSEGTLGSLLSLGPSDLSITPGVSPYFSYNADFSVLTARSNNGVLATLDFVTPLPAQYTIEATLRFPELPHNFGDLETRRAGITIADDAGRGISIYFSSTGIAISRVDDFGSVTALPDTSSDTEEISQQFRTIRIAVDGGLGRAYVYIGEEAIGAEIRYIIPVEATPPTVVDLFKVFVKGLSAQPSTMEIKALRLSSTLIIPDIPPVADAGPDKVSQIGQAVRLDGRASYDVEGGPLSYAWRAVDAPFGSKYVAENSSGSTIDDGDGDGVTATLSFTPNSLPSWAATDDVLRIGSGRYTIATVDNAGGSLTISTDSLSDSLSATPFRIVRQSILVDADTETPYVVPDVQGIYRFELVVSDGVSDSEAAEVLVNMVGARAPFGVEPDVTPIWSALGDEWPLVENRGVFEEAWRGVAQLLSGKLLEAWQHHYNYSIRDAQRTFQRKWLAYRTLITETDPDSVEVLPRYGVLKSTHEFEAGDPTVSGTTLVFTYHSGTTAEATLSVTVTFSGNDLSTIIADINTALSGTGISAYSYAIREDNIQYRIEVTGASTIDDGDGDRFTTLISFTPLSLPSWVAAGDTLVLEGERYTISTTNNVTGEITISVDELPDNLSGASFLVYRHCRLGLKATSLGFYLDSTSTGAVALGLSTAVYNTLKGTGGALVTDRTYFAGDGIDLTEFGVSRDDLLVLNNGQTFRVDRVLTGAKDPMSGQRLLLSDALPLDATAVWVLPSLLVSAEVDYEYEGSYPNDLVKAEIYDETTNDTTDALGYVLGQKGKRIAAYLKELYGAFTDTARYEVRLLGVRRRKGIPIYDDTVSIPRLQDAIPQSASPTVWEENQDYILEPFYRDVNDAPIPFLQFHDSVFVDTDTEPPDILWAELTVFSNDPNVESLFGVLAGFTRDDASVYDSDFNYVAGVAGLLYAQQRGPVVFSTRIGAQILLGQSFAEVDGVIEEIRDDYSPTTGRVLIRDATGDSSTTSEVVRTYYYKKDPLDTSATSGLALNPDTSLPWAEGDEILQFYPIGAGVEVVDLYNDPKWYLPWVRSGLITELEKFHTFLVRFNLDLVSVVNLVLLKQFITKVKPKYTFPLMVGLRTHSDDLDIVDSVGFVAEMKFYDSLCSVYSYRYDDLDGSGVPRSAFDDGSAYYDALVDCPLDLITFLIEIDWAGGILTYDSAFFLDSMVTDVLGTYVAPGGTFTPTYDLNLPAGTYQVTANIKSSGVVLP